METTKELKDWIDTNIKSIGLKKYEDFFTKKTGYCPSKWKNDFKDFVKMTLRDYLIKEKMKICWDYKMGKQNCGNVELMLMVSYDLTARSFNNHMREYERKYLNKDTGSGTDEYLFHNTAVFSEILVRLILYLDLAKPEIEDNFFLIEQNVKDTAYQIDNLSPTETIHCYKAFIGLDDLSFYFMGPWVENSLDDEGIGRFYNGMEIYIYYLERVNNRFHKQTGLSLTNSIKGWDNFRKNTVIRLEINRRSKFILATDAAIYKIKKIMLDRSKQRVMDSYSVAYDTVLNYVRAVNKLSYLKMKRVLETVDTLNDENAINLFLELTQCPYLNDVLWMDSGSNLDYEFVCKLSRRPKTEIIQLLIDFKKKIEQYEDDEDYEENIHNWCQKVVERW